MLLRAATRDAAITRSWSARVTDTVAVCAMRLADRRAIEWTFVTASAVFCCVVDLPRVTGLPPRVYLTRGLAGRLDCPVDANPPVSIILWAKNGVMVADDGDNGDRGPAALMGAGGGGGRRLRTSRHGTLFIRPVDKTDEGRYVCTPYSPLGKGPTSMPVQVFVRGQSSSLLVPVISLFYRYDSRYDFVLRQADIKN